MKRIFLISAIFSILLIYGFAENSEITQNDTFSTDDDLFTITSDDDLFFSDDDFFENSENSDSVIEEVKINDSKDSASFDLSRGILFQNGSIKIGGKLDTSLSALTTLWADDDKNLGEYIYETKLTPKASAYLTVDARPSQNLRMYTKFGFAYPFKSSLKAYATTTEYLDRLHNTSVTTLFSDYFKVKELFTDFSIADRAFFRFGLHTVTWGAGYFFSPVSDIINTSSIDPEDVTAQVNGSLNLRTQIVIPKSQNCFWFYIIPSTNFINSYTLDTYLRDTALAGKFDLLLGNWELGFGGYYKYQNPLKMTFTATGNIWKINFFGEFVYQYGADSEWTANKNWDGKTNIFQATAGFLYYWKNPLITLVAQYYYDGNEKDEAHKYITKGNNIAVSANFGKIFGTKDLTATIFAMANFNKDEIPTAYVSNLEQLGIAASYLQSITVSTTMSYSPLDFLTFSAGPYFTWQTLDSKPQVSLKLTASLGGGKF